MSERVLRPPTADELGVMQAIAVSAGQRFREVGLPEIAEDPPPSLEELDEWRREGRTWVADVDGEVVGFVLVDLLDGGAHVEELAVALDHQGEGHGAALLEHAVAWARDEGYGHVSLTTFTDVPFNRPFYERFGFRVLADDEVTPELLARRLEEAEHGLDPAIRVCMVRGT